MTFAIRPMNNAEQRYCKDCDKVLPLNSENFHRKGLGFQYLCKPCMRVNRSAAWLAEKARRKVKKDKRRADFLARYSGASYVI